MQQIKKEILNYLQQLKGSGKFASMHTTEFLFPGLEVAGLGELAYPINKIQAEVLIKAAHKAPFGQGTKTIIDDNVRSAWEIDADKLSFNNPEWNQFLNNALGLIKSDLGLEDYIITAHLYKLLIYREGDFFLPHKDSEKEKGMFGTLVIGLPSLYTGGALEISFEGVTEIADFAKNDTAHTINYAAFYADCDHEVKPLTSGYRVCLVYNLVQKKAGKKIELQSLHSHAAKLAEIFTKHEQKNQINPYIILLGHQYTPENFLEESLKLNDRAKAETLMLAAKQVGFYSKLCLVTSYLAGSPEYSGGYGYDDEDEDAEMDEVYDEALNIEYWAENELPALSKVSFEDNDLITSFPINDGDPIIKESSGYMGNYGPDLMHWYHYGAVMIWSPQVNAQLLLSQDTGTQLNWIDYFSHLKQVSEIEATSIKAILSTGLGGKSYRRKEEKENFNAVAGWLIKSDDKKYLLSLSNERLQFFFIKIDVEHWIKLFRLLTVAGTTEVLKKVTDTITLPLLEKLIVVIKSLATKNELKPIADEEMERLPGYFNALKAKSQLNISANALSNIFWIAENMSPTKTWTEEIATAITTNLQRQYVHAILVPQLLEVKNATELTTELLFACRQFLQHRADNQPQAPTDWSRPMPDTTGYEKQWRILKDFIQSPTDRILDYRKNQNERSDMEYAIKKVEIDLRIETIRKGSPHTLRITKTMDAHNREMRMWREDVALLEKIEK